MKKLPVIFVGHGSPMNAIEDNEARRSWERLGKMLPRPKAIIGVSAHWMTDHPSVRNAEDNPKIDDMYGFPKELYEIKYSPKGSPEFAQKIIEKLGDKVKVDNSWGMDHGMWTVMVNMYPDGDIPLTMLSIDMTAEPKDLYEIGKAISQLREEGALIIGSGNVVHNLRMVAWDKPGHGFDWADSFDEYIFNAIKNKDHDKVINFRDHEFADRAVPSVDHYYPLLVALGASREDDQIFVWNAYRDLGSLSMTSYIWGDIEE